MLGKTYTTPLSHAKGQDGPGDLVTVTAVLVRP